LNFKDCLRAVAGIDLAAGKFNGRILALTDAAGCPEVLAAVRLQGIQLDQACVKSPNIVQG